MHMHTVRPNFESDYQDLNLGTDTELFAAQRGQKYCV